MAGAGMEGYSERPFRTCIGCLADHEMQQRARCLAHRPSLAMLLVSLTAEAMMPIHAPATPMISSTRTMVDQNAIEPWKANGKTCQIRTLVTSAMMRVARSPIARSHGGSAMKYRTLAAMPAARLRLTRPMTWTVAGVRKDSDRQPGWALSK